MPDSEEAIIDKLGLRVARRHIFLCCDQAKPKCCDRERSIVAWDYLKRRLIELGLADHGVLRTKANCFRVCQTARLPSSTRKARGIASAIRRSWSGSSRNISSAASPSSII